MTSLVGRQSRVSDPPTDRFKQRFDVFRDILVASVNSGHDGLVHKARVGLGARHEKKYGKRDDGNVSHGIRESTEKA